MSDSIESDIISYLQEVLVDHLQIKVTGEKIEDRDLVRELGCDELDIVEIYICLEEVFGIPSNICNAFHETVDPKSIRVIAAQLHKFSNPPPKVPGLIKSLFL